MMAPVWRLSGLGAGEDDVLYYYPARVFFHETIRDGQWPWWNPWTGMGRPYLADPQTAVFYPFTWLFALLSPLNAYPACLWAHYSIALWGMYRLLRGWRLSRRAALFGGLSFAFCGFMLAHRAHFTMQHAAAWTPWVFWRLHRYLVAQKCIDRTGQWDLRLLWAALVITMQSLAGHFQVTVLTALGTLVFLLAVGPTSGTAAGQGVRAPVLSRGSASGRLARWLVVYLCAAGLFAVQWLPTVEYTRLCTRVQRGYLDFVENSWNPLSAIGWLLPMFFGQRTPNLFDQAYWGPSHQVEQFSYTGIVPLLLALAAFRRGWARDKRRRAWGWLAVFGLLLALGTFGPICPLLYWVPGSSLFRCPARALLLLNLAVAAMAAITLDELGGRLSPDRARLRAAILRATGRPVTLAVTLVVVPLALALLATPLLPIELRQAALHALRPWNAAIWVPLVVIGASAALLHKLVHQWQQPRALWLLTAATALDLGVIGWTLDVPAGVRSAAEILAPGQSASWIEQVRDSEQRLWVVTTRRGFLPGEYVQPIEKAVANTNLLRRVAALTDYGPLQPRQVVARFGFHPWGESWRATELLADTTWMRLFNVGWVLVCDDELPGPAECELVLVTESGWRLYRNPTVAGLALLDDPGQPVAVHHVRRSPSALTTVVDTWPMSGATQPTAAPETSAGGAAIDWPRLVVSELALPGWRATCNGNSLAVETAEGLLLSVRVPPGQAVAVEWSYCPPGLAAGAGISLATAGVLLMGVAVRRWMCGR